MASELNGYECAYYGAYDNEVVCGGFSKEMLEYAGCYYYHYNVNGSVDVWSRCVLYSCNTAHAF